MIPTHEQYTLPTFVTVDDFDDITKEFIFELMLRDEAKVDSFDILYIIVKKTASRFDTKRIIECKNLFKEAGINNVQIHEMRTSGCIRLNKKINDREESWN